ncbi:cellulose biosynthesis cyclic di-GMP-binding regulatory protein BcsB [Konateibacter massiliensis]|uniref:cellulose biosynthesis cyclic di-GMP-binding regulatory protein BcsB n=1 Tax=Konateibacter massiliensis TaxID=2002841 RepID=UPI000C15F3B1|nr:cellulose biosynthesis cyclic di-GMP-binding regulatory protein BcsB [Konateibacter massiliensis]
MKKIKIRRGVMVLLASAVLSGMFFTETGKASSQTATPDEDEAIVAFQAGEAVTGADRDEDATREDAIVHILSSNPEDAQAPVEQEPTLPDTTYTKDIYFDQTTLKGIFSTKELFFYVPSYWDTKYVYAEIQYDVSELIQSIASSMTFSVNNVPVSSYSIAYENGSTQTCYLEIPMDLVKEGYNSLAVSAYARLYDEEGCIDDFSNANWLSISKNSYIRSGYEIVDAGQRISYYPYPFMSTTEETGKGLSIVVSDEATDGEIAAAMNLMSDLSTETGDENNIQFCLLSDLAGTNADRTILVANYNNLTEFYQNKITDTSDLDTRGEVVFSEDSKGNPLLIVTSTNDDCLLEAAYMLMDENRVSQEKSSVASVKLGSADVAINSTSISKMAAGNYTVKDIIGSGLTFVGPFHQEQLIYLPFSEDYFLSDAGKVTLNFRYSENLDFNRSLITVYWGDIPVASKKLSKENAIGDVLTFSMPADVVGTTTGAIRIAFDLEIADIVCTPRQDEMPWAYVSDESVLYLPASTGIVLTFDLKPSPFRTDGKFNDMMLVLSDTPTTEELNLYAQIIGMYGDGVEPYGTLYVKRFSEFDENDADYNIVTVGNYNNNSLLRTLNDKLYFSYSSDGSKFNSNEQLILSDNYAGEIAILQLLESPFASNRGILAVTSIEDDMLSNVQEFMRNYKLRYSLSKDCVVIDSDLDSKSFQFIKAATDVQEPSLIKRLVENKQSLVFTVVATSVMIMIFIAVIIILIRVRMYHRKKDE